MRVTVTITLPDSSAATIVETALGEALANETAASNFIGQDVTITALPQVSARVVSLVSPSPPPPPSGSNDNALSSSNSGSDGVGMIVGVVLGVIAAGALVALYLRRSKRAEAQMARLVEIPGKGKPSVEHAKEMSGAVTNRVSTHI